MPPSPQFKRGAIPTPQYKLHNALSTGRLKLHHAFFAPPPQFCGNIPAKMSALGNSTYGDCVSAEEGAAIESYSTLCGVEYVIQDQTVIDFARKHNWLNGADLLEVIQGMEKDGMKQGNDTITDGTSSVVNYADENALQAALCTGPVKLGMDANALPSGAGQKNGWTAFGGRPGQFSNEDHSTGLWAYGPIQWLAQQIAAVYPGTPIPSQSGMGYVFYTWGTVGIVDHAWLMSTVGEAFLRTPTTLINGKALTPAPPIPPDPWKP